MTCDSQGRSAVTGERRTLHFWTRHIGIGTLAHGKVYVVKTKSFTVIWENDIRHTTGGRRAIIFQFSFNGSL